MSASQISQSSTAPLKIVSVVDVQDKGKENEIHFRRILLPIGQSLKVCQLTDIQCFSK